MAATEGYADWDDEPFVPIPLIPEDRSEESPAEYMGRRRRENLRALERSEEDFARQQQNITNWQIQEYIDEQRKRQKNLDSERELRKYRR
jgi:hypothetical protein